MDPISHRAALRRFLSECRLPLLYCLAVKLAIYLVSGNQYGYMGDELYFLEASRNLDLGYLDFPPLVAWITAAVDAMFGDSLYALRFVPFLCGTLVSMTAVAIAHALGAGRLAVWVTAIVVATAPMLVSFHAILTMNALDQLWWSLALLGFVLYLRTANRRILLAVGVVFGLGGLTKLSIALLAAAMLPLLVLYRPAVLRERYFYLGILAALAICSPFIYWQIANDFPFLAFSKAYKAVVHESFVMDSFIASQLLTMNPPNIVIWLPGLYELLFGRATRWRALGILALVVFALCYVLNVRFYFFAPMYLVLVASGAMLWERLLVPRRRRLAAGALLVFVLSNAAFGLPTGAPILPADWLESRLRSFEVDVLGKDAAAGALGRHMPHFAEMHGWQHLAERVAELHGAASKEHGKLAIIAAHFGQASAINFFGPALGLPHACSGHMHYLMWCRDEEVPAAIMIGFTPRELSALFAEVQPLGGFDCEHCTQRERDLEIVLVRHPVVSRDRIWSTLGRLYIF